MIGRLTKNTIVLNAEMIKKKISCLMRPHIMEKKNSFAECNTKIRRPKSHTDKSSQQLSHTIKELGDTWEPREYTFLYYKIIIRTSRQIAGMNPKFSSIKI